MFQRGSRYYDLEQTQFTGADGRVVLYVRRRFVPRTSPERAIAEHTIVEGDRLDNIASRYLGDPEQFWRICDANRAMRPDTLTEQVGRILLIPLPDAEGWSR